MNFYKRHLGDIAKATGHLSQGEMGAYDLLLDWCYSNEKPLPARRGDIYRIGRAASKAERDNVDRVLADFFDETPDGFTQKRVLEEMAKANAQAETNRRIAVAREERKRARTEHESCYEPLGESSENRDTNDQPSQTPDTRHHQEQEQARSAPTSPHGPPALPEPGPAVRACLLLRQAGCVRVNPSNPNLRAAIAEGVTPEAIRDTYLERPDATNPFAWAIATARGRHAEGPSTLHAGDPQHDHANRGAGRKPSAVEQVAAAIRERRERDPDDPVAAVCGG